MPFLPSVENLWITRNPAETVALNGVVLWITAEHLHRVDAGPPHEIPQLFHISHACSFIVPTEIARVIHSFHRG